MSQITNPVTNSTVCPFIMQSPTFNLDTKGVPWTLKRGIPITVIIVSGTLVKQR